MTTLDQIQPGSSCRIKQMFAQDRLGQRLLDMGVYPGLTLKVIRNAPLNDPMEIEVQGYCVNLRHAEARMIMVDAL
jgi:ferrous iron transport protein A